MSGAAASRRFHRANRISRVAAFYRKREMHKRFTSHSWNAALCTAVGPYIQDVP